MARIARTCAALTVVVVTLAAAASARGDIAPKWSDAQLIHFADLIVSGHVVDIRSGWDPAVDAIYTYITLHVEGVLKGVVNERTITVKQLGGEAGRRGLRVGGQPAFGVGEEVLLFLEVRPRDGTLYTSALWQGKWTLHHVGATRLAVRRHEAEADTRPLGAMQRAIEQMSADRRTDTVFNAHPADLTDAIVRPYVLFNVRYNFLPPVDVQRGGQPGLPGGGFAEIRASIGRWNNAGSSFVFGFGSNDALPHCYMQPLFNNRVTISFMDPCGEIDDDGGTLAVGGSYYDDESVTFVNGRQFHNASEGFIVNNNSPAAFAWLTRSGCFADIQLHELGHVLGLDHSPTPTSIMFPAIPTDCSAGPRDLDSDDVQGLLAIYPRDNTSPPTTAPQHVAVTLMGANAINLSFDPVPTDDQSSPVTSYRVYAGPTATGPVVYSVTFASTSGTIAIPDGVAGTYFVAVAGVNSAGVGPMSVPIAFTIPCTAPLAPASLQAMVRSGTATAAWTAANGATSYVLQGGTAPGLTDLFSDDLGNRTVASARGLPPGFRAYVRVIAVNACGQSRPSPDLLIQ
jgi:hypothetical protein